MTPRRVDLVSEHASPLAGLGGEDAGGQNVHVAALAEHLSYLGSDVTVLTRRDARHLPRLVELCPGVVVDHVDAGPAEILPKDALFPHLPELAAGLRRRWLADPPDIVHAHFWMSGWAASQAVPPDVPLVQTFHALGVVKRRHQGAADTSPPERAAIEADLLQRADQVVATCSDEESELLALGADPDRITVVPCGVDTSAFRPRGPVGPGPRRERHRIVAIARLVRRKGIEDLIRALPRVPDTELLVAGGPQGAAFARDPEVARLRRLAARCGVPERVTLLGALPRHKIPPLLRSADVVVSVPWYEPFGIVPLEAMACGVPVVGSAVGGLLDTVQPERTGLLVPPRTPGAVALAVNRLLDNPSLRLRMGEEAVAVVRERFTWKQVAAATLDAYTRARVRRGEWWAVSA